jgi:hypothetical protein
MNRSKVMIVPWAIFVVAVPLLLAPPLHGQTATAASEVTEVDNTVLLSSPVLAQFRWRALSTPGYAAGGMAAAAAPAFAANSIESGLAVFAVGLTGGAIVGWLIGSRAEEQLAEGEALSGRHKNAVRAGTVMAGTAAGAITSFFIINAEAAGGEGSRSDEAIFGSFVAGGAALGVVTQVLLESRLEPGPARGRLSIGPGGRPGLAVSVDL